MSNTVQALWRYPIKSLLGESLDNVDIDGRGVVEIDFTLSRMIRVNLDPEKIHVVFVE